MEIFLLITLLGLVVTLVIALKSVGMRHMGNELFIAPAAILILSAILYFIDTGIQTHDTEVWSGRIVDVQHEEEYDSLETYTTTTVVNGKTQTQTHTRWVHHNANNYVETTDGGTQSVYYGVFGGQVFEFDDSFPNDEKTLLKFFPIGTPTASTHSYSNKVQASTSIFKHPELNVDDYVLPEYPDESPEPLMIDRLVGFFPDRTKDSKFLDEMNSYMNKMIDDPDKPGKKKSWKQCNLIFVNLGDQPIESAMALEDKWEGGNKNDFIVAMSMGKDLKINWVYPITWSESEDCKLAVVNALQGQTFKDFKVAIKNTTEILCAKFERKQFADFNYLAVDISTAGTIMHFIIILIITSYACIYWYTRR